MKKRISAMLLSCLLLTLLLPMQALAANTQSTISRYEDGSYSVATVKRIDTAARASGTVTGAAAVIPPREISPCDIPV